MVRVSGRRYHGVHGIYRGNSNAVVFFIDKVPKAREAYAICRCIWAFSLSICLGNVAIRNRPMILDQHRKNPTNKDGLTILEVLVVLAIIGLLSAVVAPRIVGYLGRAKSETAQIQIDNLSNAVQLFYIDTGRYPATSEGLAALITSPANETNWNGPYMQSDAALSDPWGRDYLYEAPTEGRNFSIQSLGRDGVTGGTGEDQDLGF